MDYQTFDPELWQAIEKETNRQQNNLELIASLLWWLRIC